jgi:hypothetical protein
VNVGALVGKTMTEVQELEPGAAYATPPIDRQAFSDLFNDPEANRDAIWSTMVILVRLVAQRLVLDGHRDEVEIKGDALIHVMSKIGGYKPASGAAYSYFFKIVQHRMKRRIRVRRPLPMGDTDAAVSFHEMFQADESEMTAAARRNCSHNWRSYQLRDAGERETAGGYFRRTIARARSIYRESASPAEKAAAAVTIAVLKETRRAMLG